MTTQGIATRSPAAVAFSARLNPTMTELTAMVFEVPIVWKVSMIPRTVPKSPMYGALAATVPIMTNRFVRAISKSCEFGYWEGSIRR